MKVLDVDVVQAFVLVADFQSFTRAAEALDTSQAAISMKLKRLEERLGEKLIERTPRLVRLSARGAAFLEVAREFLAAHERAIAGLITPSRRFTLGVADQVAGPELPVLLARLHAHDPALLIEVQIEASRSLLDAFDRGALDAAIVRREDDRRDGEVLSKERFGWFAAPGFEHRQGEPLRLASLAASCGVRNNATRALDAAGIGWVEVFLGGGTTAVAAAVMAGLAVGALAHRVAPVGLTEVGEKLGLPPLPASEVVLHTSLSDGRSRGALRTLAAAFREHRTSAS
ncbi:MULTISPECIES: LysR family transcriptional regulator [unclassified Rhizobium]|uniref:LysR family transcriptional regulator n=1 Tax=unclassified Rhizobium TaxID=2613769 RepID=UPI000645B25D|nr:MULTISPECIES: LysR family transcriptional regulator [unclassified Rhizobium]MBN8954901.1 LysR family transcriptional regulator [Rhizobium tropici]OJY79137.1 MAG: LysR family transcriptional regulator [Rhizobium sp. 60-20]RKD35862.1 LysR family transcriptional regulator [Rhizobium sp. WW_1]